MKTNLYENARMLSINIEVDRAFMGYKIKVTHRDGSKSTYRFFDKDERLLITTVIVCALVLSAAFFALSRL